jgi:hypothetical protein
VLSKRRLHLGGTGREIYWLPALPPALTPSLIHSHTHTHTTPSSLTHLYLPSEKREGDMSATESGASELFGDKLLTKEGECAASEAVRGKRFVGVYFSAHW